MSVSPDVAADTAPAVHLPVLPRLLFVPTRWFRYVLIAAALSLVGALLLSAIIHWLVPDAQAPDLGSKESPVLLVTLVALFSPAIESLVMSGPLVLMNRIAGPRVAILCSAALWGVLHSLAAPTWGLAIWWPFLIFSTAFMVWRAKGYWAAVGTATVVHALNNIAPAILIAINPHW